MSTSEVLPFSQSPRSLSGAFTAGTLIDARYEIVRPIARGATAEILEARHPPTGRTVVVKLLRRDLCDRSDLVARIAREAKALGSIQHPNVIAIYDAGRCSMGGPFLITEKLDGRALDGILTARGTLGTDGATTVMRSIAMALAEVHRQGWVHRDIRLGNVFVASSRIGGEIVKLIDFGVVGEMTSQVGNRLTVVGDFPDPEGYRAPEQMADPSAADARADLYSLGVVAMQCLGVGLDHLAQTRRERRRASAALQGRDDVPSALVGLLDELLALTKSDRPASAEVVLERLGEEGVTPPLLGYAPDASEGDRPTHTEPATQRSKQQAEARRRHLRAPYITPVRIVSADERIDGRTEDISSSGLLVVVRGPAQLEGKVTVRFALPTTGRVVAVQASPKWKREHSGRTAIGLEFLDLDQTAGESIESYARFVAVER